MKSNPDSTPFVSGFKLYHYRAAHPDPLTRAGSLPRLPDALVDAYPIKAEDLLNFLISVTPADHFTRHVGHISHGFCAANPAITSFRKVIRAERNVIHRSEEHTSELQSHSFISYAVFFLK